MGLSPGDIVNITFMGLIISHMLLPEIIILVLFIHISHFGRFIWAHNNGLCLQIHLTKIESSLDHKIQV